MELQVLLCRFWQNICSQHNNWRGVWGEERMLATKSSHLYIRFSSNQLDWDSIQNCIFSQFLMLYTVEICLLVTCNKVSHYTVPLNFLLCLYDLRKPKEYLEKGKKNQRKLKLLSIIFTWGKLTAIQGAVYILHWLHWHINIEGLNLGKK